MKHLRPPGSTARLLVAWGTLALPYAVLAACLAHAAGLASLAAYIGSVGLLLWLLAFLTRTWRRFFLVQAPLWILAAVYAGYTFTYGSPPGELLAYVFATSSWDEVVGFFGIWQGERLLIGTAVLSAIYIAVAAVAPTTPIFAARASYVRWGTLGALTLMIAFAAREPLPFIQGLAVNPVIGTAMFVKGPLHAASTLVEGKGVPKVPYSAERVPGEEVHILIIGESARRDSWSAYGYSRKTTPNIDRLQSEMILFKNAVADANVTICAVPILLTGMSPAQFDMKAVHGNLVDLAGEAGYSTAWLMNQDPHISLLTGIHAGRMVYPPSLKTLAASRLPLDEILLPEFNRQIAARGRARFIGLHVIGSHWAYDSRYPAQFRLFGAGSGLTDADAISGKPNRQIVDAYDNSVAYTDWFLAQIIAAARSLAVPATVTYFSDHGEDLYALDGMSGHGAAVYSKHQFDIPAFVWMNAAFRQAHADKVQALEQNAGKEIRSHNVFYSVADLMGIHWPGQRPDESFASAAFVPDVATPLLAGAGGTLVNRDPVIRDPVNRGQDSR
jgi:glucan phosphoethanolaminetransferase (alkaline phosphatase superfamily)